MPAGRALPWLMFSFLLFREGSNVKAFRVASVLNGRQLFKCWKLFEVNVICLHFQRKRMSIIPLHPGKMCKDVSFRSEEILKSVNGYKDRRKLEEAFRHK